MLQAWTGKSRKIDRVEQRADGLYLFSERGILRLSASGDSTVRVTYTEKEAFCKKGNPGLVEITKKTQWSWSEENSKIIFRLKNLTVEVNKITGSCIYYDRDGKLLLKEREEESRCLEEYQSYRLAEGAKVVTEKVRTADGEKTVVREAAREPDEMLYHTRLHLEWQKEEALYGLGQQEEGLLNLRGHMVYVHQANRKIGIPMLVSSLGYGILVNTYAPMIFSDTEFGSYIYTEADEEMDFFFLAGDNMDGVVAEYRKITGKVALLPKWAFGYIQSQERYETQEEILRIADEYRDRGIGLDALVLDWSSWVDGEWGQKTFDASRFPSPGEMTKKLHENDIHFMISIWPNMSDNCGNYKEMQSNGLLLPSSDIYNALSEEGRKLYWKQTEEGLFRYGIDGWWCDSSEPFTPEWNHKERPEPSVMYSEFCQNASNMVQTKMTNSFALFHAQALYEGQRGSVLNDKKRVVNLTRSAWTGQQRYGTILWSGDTDASWTTLKKQIAAGLNFCASGLPFWTTDIGAFFVRRGDIWYWKGKYNDAEKDAGYRELVTRWYQWGAFLPVFRGHGTDCRRELWLFGTENEDAQETGNMFYDAMLSINKLRYRLMPYIYSLAGRTWLQDGSMIKLLAFDFPKDANVLDIRDQYMFGESILVCPVTEPMYFEADNRKLNCDSYTRKVYLPSGSGWYDFWTKEYYEGGQWIDADAPIDKIPLFVKAGSILPMAEEADRVQTEDKIRFEVYSGVDSHYYLYKDEGDGYGYEQGEYTCDEYIWSEEKKKLTDLNGNEYPCTVYQMK